MAKETTAAPKAPAAQKPAAKAPAQPRKGPATAAAPIAKGRPKGTGETKPRLKELYHKTVVQAVMTSNPPKRAGVCDECGGELYQRDDDAETTVRKRLDVYQRQTAPLLDYYRQRSLLATVSGEGPVATIRDSIRAATGVVR